MANQLNFNLSEVVSLAEHAKSSTEFRKRYGESSSSPALWWVKDQGTYLMSNGLPQPKPNVTYAEGYGPDCDYMALRETCGGDDFVEVLPDEILETLLTMEGREGIFQILVCESYFDIKILAN